jgi:hypothetical protein
MVEVERCKGWSYDEVTSNHFTGGCGKPYDCIPPKSELCRKFTEDFHKYIAIFTEKIDMMETRKRCDGRHRYVPLNFSKMKEPVDWKQF